MNFLLLSSAAITVLIISVLVLLIFSFILSGSEVAFFSLSPKDINILKTRKHPSIKRVVSLLEEPKTLLGVMLVANSFINIGIILITNLLIENWLEFEMFNSPLLHFLMKVVVVSFLLVLFAEVLPKVWATHHKVWFASMSSLIVEVFYSIFYKLSKRFVGYSDNIEKRISPQSGATLDNTNLDYAIDLLPEDEASNEEKQILKLHQTPNFFC
jgi:Mg2+/Co2+ transporter CorB